MVNDIHDQTVQRKEKLSRLRQQGNPYPNDFRRDSCAKDVLEQCEKLSSEQPETRGGEVKLAGRLISKRIMGKASFAHIQDESGRIQLYAQRDRLPDGQYNDSFKKLDIGDIIGVVGKPFITKTGELTIELSQFQLLVKSLHPLPEKYHGLTNVEIRYRQRYVDLLVSEASREVFRKRTATVRSLRKFLDDRGYIEIESPIMQAIPGGANAKPFVTHHNALDRDLYLRVAQELYIKRCLVGGFERVYELNRNFRNEGLSTQHNPEFTMLEYNEAYLDYIDYMDLTEEMLRMVAQNVNGTTKLEYEGHSIDLAQPFERLSMCEATLRYNPKLSSADLTDQNSLASILATHDLEADSDLSVGNMLMLLFEETVEDHLIQPTYITGYPEVVSPLSRRNDHDSSLTDRFELFVVGRELANGFSELNDAEDQATRFERQAAAKSSGDEEAMFFDQDYITALEYGLPPNAGGGLGVDRFVMLLTGCSSIRDVLLFPHLRSDSNN